MDLSITSEIKSFLKQIFVVPPIKLILSQPISSNIVYKRMVFMKTREIYHVEKFTLTQAFHENIDENKLIDEIIHHFPKSYRQVNIWNNAETFQLRISKKGKLLKNKKSSPTSYKVQNSQDRQKTIFCLKIKSFPPL